MDASDGGDDVEMGEVVDNQKTPKKFQPVKRAIVISPASEVPAKRQQRRTSAAAKAAAKAIGHLPNPVRIVHPPKRNVLTHILGLLWPLPEPWCVGVPTSDRRPKGARLSNV